VLLQQHTAQEHVVYASSDLWPAAWAATAPRHAVFADWRLCVVVRLQGLNPGKAIAKIKQSLHKGSPT
jgi:hypothetical protein